MREEGNADKSRGKKILPIVYPKVGEPMEDAASLYPSRIVKKLGITREGSGVAHFARESMFNRWWTKI